MLHFQFDIAVALQSWFLPTHDTPLVAFLRRTLRETQKAFRITDYLIQVGEGTEAGIAISVSSLDQLSFLNVNLQDLKILAPLNAAGVPDRDPILECKPRKEVTFLSWAEVQALVQSRVQKECELSQLRDNFGELIDQVGNAVENVSISSKLVVEFLNLLYSVHTYTLEHKSLHVSEGMYKRILSFHGYFCMKVAQNYPTIGLQDLLIGPVDLLPLEEINRRIEDLQRRLTEMPEFSPKDVRIG